MWEQSAGLFSELLLACDYSDYTSDTGEWKEVQWVSSSSCMLWTIDFAFLGYLILVCVIIIVLSLIMPFLSIDHLTA